MNILITGGSGMIGSAITKALVGEGHNVRLLSRRKRQIDDVEVFEWDIESGKIDERALENLDAVVHLAGEGVADKKWTNEQKAKIISSRIDSAGLLFNSLSKLGKKPSVFISASGVGYYGSDTGEEELTEDHPKGDGFLAEVVEKWEESATEFEALGIRTIKLRKGMVLSKEGGALDKILMPIKYWVGSPLGTGKQQVSWVHIDDLVGLVRFSLHNDKISGTYNAVSSHPVTNEELTRSIARVMGKPLFMPRVPAFVLRWVLGEMSSIVTGGNRASNQKIKRTGFKFQFEKLQDALVHILDKY